MREKIGDFGGEIPRNYDRYLGPVLFEHYADDLSRRVAATGAENVLELACGTGILTRRLLHDLPTSRILATDLSDGMLDFARQKLGPAERLEWRQADAMTLPFADASFDAVVCQFGWMFLSDKTAAAREALRVLRPGGSFLFNVWDSLARNDLPRVVHVALAECFPADPPGFLPFAFGYHERAVITAAVAQAGFGRVELMEVAKHGSAAPVRDVATGLLTGTPLHFALLERGTADPASLIDAIAARLADEFGDPPAAAHLLALIVKADAA